jgi:translocation and assembly module TamB
MCIRDREKREPTAPTAPGWEIHTRVTVILGDEVRFTGFGLSARLAGRVQVTDTPGQVTLGEGEVSIVQGEYEAYGQKLTISAGRLVFAGPVTNPVLDVRVTREVDDITAGLQVSGTPRAPQITVFSDPTMPQADALSYLLLGRPLNQASDQEGRLLVDAVSTLGVKGGEFLAKRIGQSLGLQEVQVQTGDTLEETSLVVGQYLSPRLYLSYGLGLFSEGYTVRLRYRLSEKLTLQVEGGAQQRADLLYNIEYE